MTISEGSKLGPYEIVAPLGAGGMGEVWKALDPRIGREVAVKILHPAMSENEELVRRFEQEARTVGQLNHPNLIAVHDVGKEGAIAYLVTELLEGDTLRERLSGGALPMRRAIEWSSGIASGLAAAHEKGIVHRDLKPENIFVTKDNRVKILDFGLARLMNVGLSDSGETDAPTDHRTDPGKVMGTVGYMSPEQVRAQSVDHRSDIFSFGAILYEMLTGVRAFRRDSSIETMNAILKEEPPELTATNPNLHPGLERIVRHCLEKHPEARFQSAKDMAFDLESLSATSGSVPAIAALKGRIKLVLPIAALAVLILVALGSYWFGTRSTRLEQAALVPSESPRFTDFRRLTFRRGNVIHARLTRDGKTAVYSAAWDGRPMEVFVAQLEDRVSRPLGIERADVLSISSKGEIALLLKENFVYATAGLGTLARVPMGGGVPREVLENVETADWSPDGEELAVIRYDTEQDQVVLEYPIGRELLRQQLGLQYLAVSSDGERIAVIDQQSMGGEGLLRIVERDGSTWEIELPELQTIGLPRWVSDHEVVVSDYVNSSIWLVDLDGTRRVLLEAPALEVLDTTMDGVVLFEREIYRSSIHYGAIGLNQERDLGWLDNPAGPVLSGSGQLLFTEVGEGAGADGSFFIRNVDGSPPVMLGEGFATDLSPDGKWVASATGSDSGSLKLVPTGAGLARELEVPGMARLGGGVFVDAGRRLFVVGTSSEGAIVSTVVDLETSEVEPLEKADIRNLPVVSPDGKRAAYRSAGDRIVLHSFEGGEPEPLVGSEEGDDPVGWSGDGRSIWVTSAQALPRRVFRIDLDSGRRTPWKDLAPADLAGVIRIERVAVAPDGRSWVYSSVRVTDSDLYTARLTGLE